MIYFAVLPLLGWWFWLCRESHKPDWGIVNAWSLLIAWTEAITRASQRLGRSMENARRAAWSFREAMRA